MAMASLPALPELAAQAGDQRHRAIPARHHERDEALAQRERRALAAWSKRTATPGAWAEERGASVSSITTKHRRAPISRRTIRHSADIRPSSRNRSSIQCASRAAASALAWIMHEARSRRTGITENQRLTGEVISGSGAFFQVKAMYRHQVMADEVR